jgi:hypothetical protein
VILRSDNQQPITKQTNSALFLCDKIRNCQAKSMFLKKNWFELVFIVTGPRFFAEFYR